MREQPEKQAVQEDFAEAKRLQWQFEEANSASKDAALSEEERHDARREVVRLRSVIEAKTAGIYEYISPFEQSLSLREQYENQKAILERAGILIRLQNGELGIKTITGAESPFPSLREVSARLKKVNVPEESEHKGLIEKKIDEGFKKLLVVPFGMPIVSLDENETLDLSKNAYGLANIYARHLVEASLQGGLCYDDGTPIPEDKFNRDNPLYVTGDLKGEAGKGADIEGSLLYRLSEFRRGADKKPLVAGATKQDILKDPSAAFRIILAENDPLINRADENAERMGGRPRLDTSGMHMREYMESGKTAPNPYEYHVALEGIKKENRIYRGERGQTVEEALTEALRELLVSGRVMHDHQGKGSIEWLIGSVFTNGGVPYFDWDRGDGLARLDRYVPGFCSGSFGVRPVAGER